MEEAHLGTHESRKSQRETPVGRGAVSSYLMTLKRKRQLKMTVKVALSRPSSLLLVV